MNKHVLYNLLCRRFAFQQGKNGLHILLLAAVRQMDNNNAFVYGPNSNGLLLQYLAS